MVSLSRIRLVWLAPAALLALAHGGGCAPVTSAAPEGGAPPFEASAGSEDDASGGGGAGDANSCHPGDVETYTPGAYHPATAAHQGVCAPNQLVDPIGLYYDLCLGPGASKAACDGFSMGYAPCAACILTPDTADHYGPLIAHGDFIIGNVAGCIELADPAGLSCAKALQALDGCDLAACEANCPVHDPASLAAFGQCTSEAEKSGCESFATVAQACTAAEADAGPTIASACLAPWFKDFYDAVVPLFCGRPPPSLDASAPDAGGD